MLVVFVAIDARYDIFVFYELFGKSKADLVVVQAVDRVVVSKEDISKVIHLVFAVVESKQTLISVNWNVKC